MYYEELADAMMEAKKSHDLYARWRLGELMMQFSLGQKAYKSGLLIV